MIKSEEKVVLDLSVDKKDEKDDDEEDEDNSGFFRGKLYAVGGGTGNCTILNPHNPNDQYYNPPSLIEHKLHDPKALIVK
eukprot:771672-Amorphochlora_amoeboformis.AAC.1